MFGDIDDIDAEIELETQLRNSSITITKLSNFNDESSYFSNRKTINFDHLKKSKDLNLTFLNGKRSTIRMFEVEDAYQVKFRSKFIFIILTEFLFLFFKKFKFSSSASSLLEKPIDILKYELSSETIQKCVCFCIYFYIRA